MKTLPYNKPLASNKLQVFMLLCFIGLSSVVFAQVKTEYRISKSGTQLKIMNRQIPDLAEILSEIQDEGIKLKTVYLYNNKLDSLPDELWEIASLETLVVSSNQLVNIPDGLGKLFNLKKISFRHNRIEHLSFRIGRLASLVELHLEHNRLVELPTEIGALDKLEYLNLHDNLLKYLPHSMGFMQSLNFLIVGENDLEELPMEIGQLEGLYELDLAYSGLILKIPNSFSNLRNLDLIRVDATAVIPPGLYRTAPKTRVEIVPR